MTSRDENYQRLLEVACSRDPSASLEAARVLDAMPDPGRFEAMVAILRGANSLVGELAANAMVDYGERGLDALIEALPEARPLSQMKIITTLERLGQPRAAPSNGAQTGTASDQHRRAAEALMALLTHTNVSLLRTLAIQALGRIGAVQAAPLIRTFADDSDHHVRERVKTALEVLEQR